MNIKFTKIMESGKSFKILEGSYKAALARELILNGFNEQIKLQNRELLKCKIYGVDTLAVERQIEKLETERHQLLDYFKSTEGDGQNSFLVQISFNIHKMPCYDANPSR